MKNLLLALFLLMAGAASAQVQDTVIVSANPAILNDELGDTQVTMIQFVRGTFRDRLPDKLVVQVRLPSGNASTVQINTYGDTFTLSDTYAAGDTFFLTISDRLWIKLNNANDEIEFIW